MLGEDQGRSTMKELVLVSHNQGKLEDSRRLLPGYSIRMADIELPEMQSMEVSYIVRHKVRAAYEAVKEPCFVMDTGLYIEYLNGLPGPFIRYFYDLLGSDGICALSASENRKCTWVTCLAYYDGELNPIFQKTADGTIATVPRGDAGYSWDPIYIPLGQTRTLAEMTFEEKQSFAATKPLMDEFAAFLEIQARAKQG
jgi:XTP/dITP diphosphohydrolase